MKFIKLRFRWFLNQKRSFKSTGSLFDKCINKGVERGLHILFLDEEKNEYEIWAIYCDSKNNFDPKIFDQILFIFKFIEK